MKMYVQKTIRFDMEDAKKLNEMADIAKVSFNAIVNGAIKGFLAKNKDLFPLKEDPEKQKKREETPLATIDMSKLKLESNEETVEW